MELRHLQARRGGLIAAARILGGVEPLLDAHGRTINDLRVSVTDRCNFRCRYCMPAEGMRWLDRADLLSFEEIERLVGVLRAAGDHRCPADRRRAAGAPRLPEPGCDAAADRGDRGPVDDHERLPARTARRRSGRGGDRPRQRLDRLARPRPLPRDHPPRRAPGGAARTRGDRRARAGPPDQGQRSGDAGLHRGRGRSASRTSPARATTRSGSSSSCPSTGIATGVPIRS